MIERCPPPVESRFFDVVLLKLSAVLAERMGLDFSRNRLRDLERGVISAASELGFADPEECLRYLTLSTMTREQLEVLASHITVGETYFFREQKSFEALQRRVLPKLTSARRQGEQRIRVWSAGCATGEEPYSLAMLLDAAVPELKEWTVTILATDINPRFLENAKTGVYSEWSFRDTPQWIRERYFRKTRAGFAVLPRIRNMVTFAYHNLVEDPYPSLLNSTNAMDVIFCRNVLMYFSPVRAREVIGHFHRSLIDGGWLIVSPVETSQALFSSFETVNFPGVIFYKKSQAAEPRVPAFAPEFTVPERLMAAAPAVLLPQPRPRESAPFLPRKGEARERVETPGPYETALLLYAQGRYAEAVNTLSPQAPGAHKASRELALLARAFANQGRLHDALLWCEQAIAADKLNPGLYYLAATVLEEQGQGEKAAIALKRAIYLDRNFVLAHFALGNLARRQGKAKESKKHFENARSLLASYGHDDVLPESEGMIAGRLRGIIQRLAA